jgi:multidrug efflux system membrane fusion protein
MHTRVDVRKSRPKRRRVLVLAVTGIAVVAVVAGWAEWRRGEATARTSPPQVTIPVTVSEASQRDVPIFLDGLGTVQASNTVAIHSQVDGKLQSVNFVEGQEVHKGDTLAVIDPRTFQAALDQATAKKAQDQAQLVAAQKDLERFKALAAKSFETQQNLDNQQAKVDQLKASIASDQGAIENAQTQLSYTTITGPIDGRVGFRQVDAGNIIHANDASPLTVLTQTRPSTVTFTLPQGSLEDVREAMRRGQVLAIASDQDNTHELAQGTLMLIDNQIDQATSTIRLKASFANNDERLWPGEFVRVRIQVDTRKDAVTIPQVALQRGPRGFYTWVIKPDNTAEQREITATTIGDLGLVTKGLTVGERVVTNGQYRLQAGVHVESRSSQADNAPDHAS